MKKIVVLGSTGSVGKQTLAVIQRFPEEFQVAGLVAGTQMKELATQIRTFGPETVSVANAQARQELTEYFAGTRRTWTLPLDVDGSAFFQEVWTVLRRIPYGQTHTYTQLAADAGRPRAFRAAGAACALNPVPLIIPCHRAVGSNGSLRGFGGGLDMKRALLDMEAT